nr:response regulator [Gammaproteobacteria bacterium]
IVDSQALAPGHPWRESLDLDNFPSQKVAVLRGLRDVPVGAMRIPGAAQLPVPLRWTNLIQWLNSKEGDKSGKSTISTLTRATILIVEDNIVNQKVAERMLRRLGYETAVVANGAEAIEMLSRQTYDLILMDCQMPVMDGYEATRSIRANEEKGTRVPIIALTGHAMADDAKQCFAAGMDDYLSKPVQLNDLSRTVSTWLATSRALAEKTDARRARA